MTVTVRAHVVGIERLEADLVGNTALKWERVRQAVADSGAALQAGVKENRLLGQSLNRRTGTLSRSITRQLENTPKSSTARVGTNLEYAAIWELGGVIPQHTIYPLRGKALRWRGTGPTLPGRGSSRSGGFYLFAKHVTIPSRTVAARPFLAPELQVQSPRIRAALVRAINGGT